MQTSTALNTTKRWWTSTGLGALICIGCCLAPVLAAAGMAGSGVLLLSTAWLEPLGVALIVVGIAGLAWSRRRARNRGCGGSGQCSSDTTASGCTCSTSAIVDRESLPILRTPTEDRPSDLTGARSIQSQP
ncbi:MerC domain-containing protein [Antrihabitans spumae]|uniref:MerC domain-containing protein n=1 Tax=Antrihabitans spumae TaxID=3373370 RepID=A0ABW7KXH1_9NOCA